jgi:hypothetical protein
MVMGDLVRAIDDDVLVAARDAAVRSDAPVVIGWWNDGVQRRFMLLPAGHHITEEPPFLPLMLITPNGQMKQMAA